MESDPGRLDLGTLHLATGEGTRAEFQVAVEPIKIGPEHYKIDDVPVIVDIAKMVGGGYSLRLRGEAEVRGTCLRCLDLISFDRQLDVREVNAPVDDDEEEDLGEGDDLRSPYVDGDIVEVSAWVRDALVLDLPATMAPPLDDDDRCLQCRRTLQDLGAPAPGNENEPGTDPRWAKLRELDLGDTSQN